MQPSMTERRYSLVLFGLSLIALLALYEFDFRGQHRLQNTDHKTFSHHTRGRREVRGRLELDSQQSECNRECGSVSIPYPFGLSLQCAQNPYFVLECTLDLGANLSAEGTGPWVRLAYASGSYTVDRYNTTDHTHVQKEYTVNGFQVERIDPGSMIINVTAIKAMGCDNNDGNASFALDPSSPYWMSLSNQFFVVGCRSSGSFSSSDNVNAETICGPISCVNQYVNNFCGPYDCCVQQIPAVKSINLKGGGIAFAIYENCGFCSILYPNTFQQPLKEVPFGAGTYGLLIDWYIPSTLNPDSQFNCSVAQADTERYECSQNAKCIDFRSSGYFCDCDLPGYEGDGYKKGTGCEDINECRKGNHSCTDDAECENTAGSYTCNCRQGMKGDGFNKTLITGGTGCTWINKCEIQNLNDCSKDARCSFNNTNGNYACTCQGDTVGDGNDGPGGTGCKPKSNLATIIGTTTAGVIVFLIINALVLWFLYRRRRRAFELAVFSAKELVDELQKHEGAKYCKIFTYAELQEATSDFSLDRKLGAGGFGTVFEGILEDGTRVAVKKADQRVGETRTEAKHFVNEIIILSQISHRNLLRLLGCCLTTEVPVLVYEFVENGDLQEHIYSSPKVGNESDPLISKHPPLNWNQRLKVAVETAEALNYLHWGTTPPIYHQDVKCANILLDNNCNVKVADFGLSRLVCLDSTEVATKVMGGTPGYLDPEFFNRFEYTDKSDVYSYGVVLLVLLTAQKPVDLSRLPQDQNLAIRCSRHMAEGLLILNLDPELGSFLEDSSIAEAIHAVAKVAIKCVSRYTDDRPTMKEVMTELQAIETNYKTRGKNARNLKQVQFFDDQIIPDADGHSSTFSSLSLSNSALSQWSDHETTRRAGFSSGQVELRIKGSARVSPR